MLLLKEGTIDIAEDLSIEAAARLKDADGVNVVSVPIDRQDLLGFVMDKEPFDDVARPPGVAYAIPYERPRDRLAPGRGQGAEGRLAAELDLVRGRRVAVQRYDPAKAKALLQQAGIRPRA